ncbi:MAG: hypothetical protein JO219_05555 [Candidatus Eremiobacteraeota bacterium]|nr:hypothetical protein [Candidatus Eremiobacteraeota bacterium]
MIRLRLRVMVAGYNQAVAEYTLARLEITSAHPRIAPPPIIDRLGSVAGGADPYRAWRAAIRQLRAADTYIRVGAGAVVRRHSAWSRLAGAFGAVRQYAAGIETLHASGTRRRRRRSS